MGFADEERFWFTRIGRSRKSPPIVVVERGGAFQAWLDGRGHIRGFGKTAKEATNALKGLL